MPGMDRELRGAQKIWNWQQAGSATVERFRPRSICEIAIRDSSGRRRWPAVQPGDRPTSIGDSGCGITEELEAQVVEPFFSANPAAKGAGLGLPMVKASVDQWGGHIDVQSAVGRGMTMSIYVPSQVADLAGSKDRLRKRLAGPSCGGEINRGNIEIVSAAPFAIFTSSGKRHPLCD
ncbi:ATP-binding protein [Mesorhizobium argentiipisi]